VSSKNDAGYIGGGDGGLRRLTIDIDDRQISGGDVDRHGDNGGVETNGQVESVTSSVSRRMIVGEQDERSSFENDGEQHEQ